MALEIAIDTNRYRDFVDGDPEAVSIFRRALRICIPLVVIAELRSGFAVGTRGPENERIFDQFLHRERIEIVFPTMETTRHYANLYRQLRKAGTPVPANDLWIAAMVIQHNLVLYSRDSHFDVLPQIPRI